jgi:hypothetical protein
MSRRSARYRAGRHSPFAFTTAARDRRYIAGYVPDMPVRAKHTAGIEEFRQILEGTG